ncbi:MAG: type III toxin-antitoxin system ToxN/AbiQ family toxin [Oscillospiraceae bacterium]|nr:type III toxin-antitoxin system ToxN/AbiQ family toxin [Oscillospiraceae bacterium]
MRLYNVKDEYISYLRQFEPKVLFNKEEKRPYVGVVFEIDALKYYVPLSSPKPKFARMNNAKDFHKIAGGTYGAINFNKMIPIRDSELIPIDIEKEKNESYKNLLRNQYAALSNMTEIILRKSTNIHALFMTDKELTENDKRVKDRCCDFLLLEKKMFEHIS